MIQTIRNWPCETGLMHGSWLMNVPLCALAVIIRFSYCESTQFKRFLCWKLLNYFLLFSPQMQNYQQIMSSMITLLDSNKAEAQKSPQSAPQYLIIKMFSNFCLWEFEVSQSGEEGHTKRNWPRKIPNYV